VYRLTTEQQAIIRRVSAIADQQIGPFAERVDRDAAFPRESIAALAAGGFLGLTVPPEYGGMGQGLRVAAAVLDEVGQRCSSTAC